MLISFLFRVRSERRIRREEMKNITDLVEVNTAVTSHEPDFINNCKVPGTADSSAKTEMTLVELKALEDDY